VFISNSSRFMFLFLFHSHCDTDRKIFQNINIMKNRDIASMMKLTDMFLVSINSEHTINESNIIF